MPTTLLLDSNVLGRVVHPDPAENRFVVNVVGALLIDPEYRLVVPEIIDYELRRSLLLNAGRNRRWAVDALRVLDELVSLGYEELRTETFRLAAQMWAQARLGHQPGTPEAALDVDVIPAAQAKKANGLIATENERHFRALAPLFDLRDYALRIGLPS